jgi:hypothetical protein
MQGERAPRRQLNFSRKSRARPTLISPRAVRWRDIDEILVEMLRDAIFLESYRREPNVHGVAVHDDELRPWVPIVDSVQWVTSCRSLPLLIQMEFDDG